MGSSVKQEGSRWVRERGQGREGGDCLLLNVTDFKGQLADGTRSLPARGSRDKNWFFFLFTSTVPQADGLMGMCLFGGGEGGGR